MSGDKVVMRSIGISALLFVVGCASQTALPAPVPVVSPSPSPSPYYNTFRPAAYPQQYVGGPQQKFNGAVYPPQFNGGVFPQQYNGGAFPQQYNGGAFPQQFNGGAFPQQFVAGPNVAQRYYNGQNPAYTGQFVPILQQSFDLSPEGSYSYSFQSADGTQKQESGSLKYPGVQGYPPVMSVQGSYSAITPEGIPIEVAYLADENGFQPTGPGVHPAIQRAVAQQVAQAKLEPPQLNK